MAHAEADDFLPHRTAFAKFVGQHLEVPLHFGHPDFQVFSTVLDSTVGTDLRLEFWAPPQQ
tara:strand:- start:368 stop:550 length:183 start_codon:yes stop_codon:yes gene_type:complete